MGVHKGLKKKRLNVSYVGKGGRGEESRVRIFRETDSCLVSNKDYHFAGAKDNGTVGSVFFLCFVLRSSSG